ncbi:Alpha beta hydrolase fold-5 protein [Rutstroemia sp. NJR-2017a WRK4]|nr:Alpha beta hydrolase fold-5 protein [Rutstroemia sp. NJR-2017a WRK4]
MRAGRASLQLGESWVVEGDEDNEEYSPPNETEYTRRPRTATPRRSNRATNRSPDPEFVMPPLDADTETLANSWSEHAGRSPHAGQEARRRNSRQHTTHESPDRRSRTKPVQNKSPLHSSSKPRTFSQHSEGKNAITSIIEHVATSFTWLLEILGGALRILKTPLSYLVAIWLLFGLGILARTLVTSFIYSSLTPICRIPGSSLLNLPFCSVQNDYNSNGPPPSVEFDQLMKVQSQFEDVLTETAGGVSLPLDMKQGESYLRDLRQLVRYSQLKSRNELVLEFDGFIDTAKLASWDLTRFNSHVGRAVDSVIAITRYTSRVLDGIQEQEDSRGSIIAFVNDKLLAPFQPAKFTERLVLDQYIKHTGAVEDEIRKLITDAQALLMILTNLEDRLEVIGGIAVRDGLQAQADKDETLSQLWAWLGGHRGKINKLNGQLDLLKQIELRRKIAFAHVSGTLLKLQEMGAGLEDLRERVGTPELLRDKSDTPLSVHIENIQRGIDRLEERRLISRKSESAVIQRTRERVEMEGTLIEG